MREYFCIMLACLTHGCPQICCFILDIYQNETYVEIREMQISTMNFANELLLIMLMQLSSAWLWCQYDTKPPHGFLLVMKW